MAMETDRSEVVYEAKLRAAGVEPLQRRCVQDRLSHSNVRNRVGNREGRGQDQDGESGSRGDRDHDKDRGKDQGRQQGGAAPGPKVENRICDGCGVRRHLRKNCPDRKKGGEEKTPTTESDKGEKHPASERKGQLPRARTAATHGGLPIGTVTQHRTISAKCTNYGKDYHTAAQ